MNKDLISRQDAIKEVSKYVHSVYMVIGNGTLSMAGCMDVAEEILEGLPSMESEPKWVPCSERLPEDGRYLVTRFDFVTNTCFLDILWYEKGVWWNRLYTGDFAAFAWMPLPEPYKGGDAE